MHTQAGETFGATTGNDEAKEPPGHRRACLRGCLSLSVPRSREYLSSRIRRRCRLAASAEPHFLRDFTDGSQPPRPISIKRKSKELERRPVGREDGRGGAGGKGGRLRHRFKIRLLLPRMRGYLQILQRYRTYAYALPKIPPRIG